MKLYYKKEYLESTKREELFLIAPFIEDYKNYETLSYIVGDTSNELTTIEECDYVVMPYKWSNQNSNTANVIAEAKENNKKVLVFYLDDSDEDITVENSIVFRSSVYKSKRKINERAIPAFKIDRFTGDFGNQKLSVGFCGQIHTPIRVPVIKTIYESDIPTDFIIRYACWPSIESGKTKEQVISEFYANMNNNLFNVCMRGGGNFSYRFYETLMMGRIPVLLNTDMLFPYGELIDWNNHAVITDDIDALPVKIKKFYESNNINKVQIENRKLWVDYLSPLGAIRNIKKLIEEK